MPVLPACKSGHVDEGSCAHPTPYGTRGRAEGVILSRTYASRSIASGRTSQSRMFVNWDWPLLQVMRRGHGMPLSLERPLSKSKLQFSPSHMLCPRH